jgi:hypothetical protein
MDVQQLFRDAFPVRSDRVSLELVDLAQPDDGSLKATVRLIVWDVADDGVLAIRDVKEQEVWLGPASGLADPRLPACIAGWALALEQLFAQDDHEWVECLMPHDLMPSFVGLLALKRPRTPEDFAEALLGSKQRLGRFLKS